MTTYTRPRVGAIALGTLCAAATAYVLLEDVAHGAPVTTSHVLSALAVVVAIAAGHMAWPAIREGRIVGGVGLVLLFTAATTYTVITAGARNADLDAARDAAILEINRKRAAIEPLLAEAREMQVEQLARVATDCKAGDATNRCRGAKTSLAVYEAAIKGHEADLAKLGPRREPGAGYLQAARVIAALPGLSDRPEEIAGRLALIIPALRVLVAELGTIVFFGVSGARIVRTIRPANDDAPEPTIPPHRPAKAPSVRPTIRKSVAAPDDGRKSLVLADIQSALSAGRTYGSQRDLCTRHDVARSTMSDWLTEWEAAGAIPKRRTDGRSKVLKAA